MIETKDDVAFDIPFYITKPQICPYLPDRFERKIFTALEGENAIELNEKLTRLGFRRSQKIMYRPACAQCQSCISTRIVVRDFHFSKNQRKLLRRNQDISARFVDPIASSEQYDLFKDYIHNRHHDGSMADMGVLDYAQMVEHSAVKTKLREYRFTSNAPSASQNEDAYAALPYRRKKYPHPLIGVVLSDILSDALSMTYSFYDPYEAKRSLGRYMILEHIQTAKEMGLDYLYLGFWVKNSPKMDYKAHFHPLEGLSDKGWVRLEKG